MLQVTKKYQGQKSGQKFCERLPFRKNLKVQWLGLSGYSRLDDDRQVRIQLCDRGHSGTYAGFLVTLISKSRGELAAQFFSFATHIRPDRVDTRPDYTRGGFYVWSNSGEMGWYIMIPKYPEDICRSVEKWIKLWR